jgi:hypothetical protein
MSFYLQWILMNPFDRGPFRALPSGHVADRHRADTCVDDSFAEPA